MVRMLRCHAIPYSANVDRVALAAGLKGLEVHWVVHPYEARAEVERVSGQSLVPVLEDGDTVISDSPRILRYLDEIAPDPLLWPDDDPVLRARVDVLVEWFNGVWKGPPNALEALWKEDRTDDALEAQLAVWTPWFEALLGAGDYLLGDRLTAADVVIWPFLRYAAWDAEPLPYVFEHVLQQVCGVRDHPRLMAWIARMEALPRA